MKGTHSESDNCAVQKYKPPVVGKALQTLIDVSLIYFRILFPLLSAKLDPIVKVSKATTKYPQILTDVPPFTKVVPHIYGNYIIN
jgi:hypothetical protein